MAVVGPSRKEKTCLEYRLHQTLDKPSEFILYEHWENKAAHEDLWVIERFTERIRKIS